MRFSTLFVQKCAKLYTYPQSYPQLSTIWVDNLFHKLVKLQQMFYTVSVCLYFLQKHKVLLISKCKNCKNMSLFV